MSECEKLYLYDIEMQVDLFYKKTSYDIREDEHRLSHLDNDKVID